MQMIDVVRATVFAVAAFAIVLPPCVTMASWEIYNPQTDAQYWTYSNIASDGQGDVGEEFKVSMYHGSVAVAEKRGTTDPTEGQWDHTFQAPSPGWPSGHKQITLWSKDANNAWASEDEVLIEIVEIQ